MKSAGNVTINAPSSGTTVTINGTAGVTASHLVMSGSTTAAAYLRVQNTTGDALFGTESSAGGALITSSPAYATAIRGPQGISFSANGGSNEHVRLGSAGNVTINAPSSGVALAVSGVSGTHSITIADSAGTGGFKAGYLNIPQNAQTGNYTLVLADAGKHIYHAAGAGAGDTYTIPANGSVAYDIGTTITFINRDTTNAVSIAITTDTLTLAGAGSTGTRTLAAYGVATAVKITATEWMISGTGLS